MNHKDKWFENLFLFYPLFLTVVVTYCLYVHCFISAILIFYFLPPLTWRILNKFFPLKEGASFVGRVDPLSPWVICHQIQLIYIIVPFAEKLLMIVPGLYSLWLRLWGSKIGKKVYWTPGVEIVDRTHVEIGDYVFLGNKTYLSPHVVRRKSNKYLLYFKKVKIGSRSFIGAWSILGPGAQVEEGTYLPAGTHVHLKEKIDDQTE